MRLQCQDSRSTIDLENTTVINADVFFLFTFSKGVWKWRIQRCLVAVSIVYAPQNVFHYFFITYFIWKVNKIFYKYFQNKRQRCTLWKTANTKVFGLVFITFTHTDFKKMVSLKHLWMWHYLRSSPCSENFQNVWKLI